MGNFGTAQAARAIAEDKDPEIRRRRENLYRLTLLSAWQSLTPRRQAATRKYRPDFVAFVTQGDQPTSPPATAGNGPAVTWQEFRAPDHDFPAKFPGKPEFDPRANRYEVKLRDLDASFTILRWPLGRDLELARRDPDKLQALHTVMAESVVRNSKGSLDNTKPVTIQGHPGQAYTWTYVAKGRRYSCNAQTVAVGDVLYSVAPSRPTGVNIGDLEQTFFDAFRLQPREAG